jgi:hypothetical protein
MQLEVKGSVKKAEFPFDCYSISHLSYCARKMTCIFHDLPPPRSPARDVPWRKALGLGGNVHTRPQT